MNEGRRVALVTAASKGLGRGSAEALAGAGFDVFACARGREGVDEVVSDLRAAGVRAAGTTCDVSDASDLERLFGALDDEFGRLDVLVSNAGGPPPGAFLDVDEDAWRRGYELTLMSAVRSIRHAVPRMRDTGYGRIFVIGSSSARHPISGLVLSNAYRPALVGLVKTLAEELAGDGITVNMVSPGRIATDRVRSLDEAEAARDGVPVEEVEARSAQSIPMGRYGDPADVGAMIAFLASEAAAYVTGQSILVDGGMVRSLP